MEKHILQEFCTKETFKRFHSISKLVLEKTNNIKNNTPELNSQIEKEQEGNIDVLERFAPHVIEYIESVMYTVQNVTLFKNSTLKKFKVAYLNYHENYILLLENLSNGLKEDNDETLISKKIVEQNIDSIETKILRFMHEHLKNIYDLFDEELDFSKLTTSSNSNNNTNQHEDANIKDYTAKEAIDFKKIISEIEKQENKLIKIPMEVVIKHFKPMTLELSKNGEPFLTNAQFISFLKRGFLNDEKEPKQKINYSNKEKGFIISIFYDFYNLSKTQYSSYQDKTFFMNLTLNCFSNWNKINDIKNFFNYDIVVRKWKYK